MNKTITALLGVGLLSVSLAGTAVATPSVKPDLSSPEKVVRGFFDAEKAGNVDLMKAYAKDESFTDEQSQTQTYQNNYEQNPLIDYKIVSKQTIDDAHVQFTVRETFKNSMDQLPDLNYTAFEVNGSWKLLIQPVMIDMNKSSADYRKPKLMNTKIKVADASSTGMTPHTTDEVYWNFTDLQAKTTILGVNTFPMVRSDGQLTLNGWQDNSVGEVAVTYQACISNGNAYTTYGTPAGVGGDYPKSGTWFTSYIQGIPYNTSSIYHMLFTNGDTEYNVNAAGNGYE